MKKSLKRREFNDDDDLCEWIKIVPEENPEINLFSRKELEI
ncbi:MAG TPA: hypothetical protein PKX15_00370 [Bacteroidales bacterium]|nr:hypothetical protein [Bacteroidales bacterium]